MSTGPTKADLQEQVDSLQRALNETRCEVEHWRKAKIADPEAECLSACVKAISALHEHHVTSRSGNVTYYSQRPNTGRLLAYLADRYESKLVEPRTALKVATDEALLSEVERRSLILGER